MCRIALVNWYLNDGGLLVFNNDEAAYVSVKVPASGTHKLCAFNYGKPLVFMMPKQFFDSSDKSGFLLLRCKSYRYWRI